MKLYFEGTREEIDYIVEKFRLLHNQEYTLQGGAIMFTVKADNPDVPYKITLPQLKDSEGNVIATKPEDFDFTVESSNPSAVEIVPDDDNDPTTGSVKFGGPQGDGTPNLGSVNVMGIHTPSGKGFSFGAQFTLVSGDVSDIAGGTIEFEGLTEDAQPEV